MNKPAKTGKRIVSWREYLAQVRAKGVGYLVAAGWMGGFLACIVGLCLSSFLLTHADHSQRLLAFATFTGLFTCGASSLYLRGRQAFQNAQRKKLDIPFTRANIADLPAPQSLVRASEEPTQAQETILLRAATSAQASETPAEQLVRPMEGPQPSLRA